MSEFPSDWHRDAYVRDVERELRGAQLRVADLERSLAAAREREANAATELARLTGTTKPGPQTQSQPKKRTASQQ